MFEILGKTNIDFMGKRRWPFVFRFMVLLGIVALVQIAQGSRRTSASISRGAPRCN